MQLRLHVQLQLQLRLQFQLELQLRLWLLGSGLSAIISRLERFVHCLGVIVVVIAVSRVVVDVLQIAIFKFLLCFILDCHGQYKYYKYIYLAMYIYICRERDI